MRIEIEPALPEDHKELVKLAKKSKYTSDFSNRMFSGELHYSKGWIRKAVNRDTGEIVGLTSFRNKSKQPETMLYFIIIHPDAQGWGVGKKLMADLEEQSPHPRVALKVEKENAKAVAFYERLGYVVEGRNEYNGKGLLMAKALIKRDPMIVQVRGTSGTGKTTLIRQVMALYHGPTIRYKRKGRKQPLGYCLHPGKDQPGRRPLGIVGHYETACGGCDTIKTLDEVFELVRQCYANGWDVLFEGLLLSAGFNRTAALYDDGFPLIVIGMDVPIEVCLESVNQRRWAKDPKKPPVNPKNTEAKLKGTRKTMSKLAEYGVDARWANREQALSIIREAFHV